VKVTVQWQIDNNRLLKGSEREKESTITWGNIHECVVYIYIYVTICVSVRALDTEIEPMSFRVSFVHAERLNDRHAATVIYIGLYISIHRRHRTRSSVTAGYSRHGSAACLRAGQTALEHDMRMDIYVEDGCPSWERGAPVWVFWVA